MAGLKGNVRLPGVGEVPKWGVLGGAGLGAVLLIAWSRGKSSNMASSGPVTPGSASSSGPFPPDGTSGNPSDPYSTDPATGDTYGNEQAAAAGGTASLAPGSFGGTGAGGDPFPWDGTVGNSTDPYSMDPATGQTYGNEGQAGTGSASGGPPFTSNAQWSQYAENYLTQTVGQDPGHVADALGLYLEGQEVDPTDRSIIDQAIAFAGNPPVAGSGGFPPQIKVKPTGPGPRGAQTSVPRVIGDSREDAESALKSAGFRYQTVPARTEPRTGYTVTGQRPGPGTRASSGSLVTLTIRPTNQHKAR